MRNCGLFSSTVIFHKSIDIFLTTDYKKDKSQNIKKQVMKTHVFRVIVTWVFSHRYPLAIGHPYDRASIM